MKEVYVCNRDEGGEGRRRRGRMQPRSPGSPGRLRTPIIIRWTLRRLEHASIIWWIEEGRILPPSSHLRLHPMSNDQLHHTSHSRYIRRHNVGVRAQHAPFSRPPVSLFLFLVLASRERLFGLLGRNLLIAKVQAHRERGRERERINLQIIPE